MKKIIHKTESVVRDMLEGLVLSSPSLELLPKNCVITRKTPNRSKVSLISGGGSGHEPAHAGFVGYGMLDAAVCGDVFASPSQVQVYQAIKAVTGDAGALLIIKNYSGDIMNFKNAAYMAKEEGIDVEYVRVDDDIAVEDSLYTVGRRGVAGTIFVHKIAGAAAEQGMSLQEVKAVAEDVVRNVRSIGFALNSCTVPAKGSPTFELPETEMEYGVGIHGEPGIRREPFTDAKSLALRMANSLIGELNLLGNPSRIALMINGFGATPGMELYVLNKYVTGVFHEKGIEIARTFVGNYMTSIDMAGASVSALKLDERMEILLNSDADTLAFKISGADEYSGTWEFNYGAESEANANYDIETPDEYAIIGEALTIENVIYLVDAMSACIIRNEVPFCELDSFAGDGDFGMSIAKGFRRLKCEWKRIIEEESDSIGSFLKACSLIIMEHCGGASGPIWGAGFRSAGIQAGNKREMSISEVAEVIQAVVAGIQRVGDRSFGRGAVVGDKTLIDSLIPCADVWSAAKDGDKMLDVFKAGAASAREGAKATENIVARMGRAGAVGERSLGHPDAGAHALGVIFTEVSELLKQFDYQSA